MALRHTQTNEENAIASHLEAPVFLHQKVRTSLHVILDRLNTNYNHTMVAICSLYVTGQERNLMTTVQKLIMNTEVCLCCQSIKM